MRSILSITSVLAAIALFACVGCDRMPGYPKPGPEVPRPDQVLDFHALYNQNCSACHGANGQHGAAIPLNNPAYLAIAGANNLRTVTANGVNGSLMPAFAHSAGGMLTDQQIDALVQGMLREWARPAEFNTLSLPPYAANAPANAADGQKAYVTACARCHGEDGRGIPSTNGTPQPQGATTFSIVDPNYLSLMSDQGLRSIIVAGHPVPNTPDWRSYIAGRSLTPQEITDIVAWVIGHRPSPLIANPHATPGPAKLPAPTSNSTVKEKR